MISKTDAHINTIDLKEINPDSPYPCECCDASEISDMDFEDYIKKKDTGFFQAYLESLSEMDENQK